MPRTPSSSSGSTARTLPARVADQVLVHAAARAHVEPGPVAEVEVPDEPDLLERLQVAVDRRHVGAGLAADQLGQPLGGQRLAAGVERVEQQAPRRRHPQPALAHHGHGVGDVGRSHHRARVGDRQSGLTSPGGRLTTTT